VTVYKSPTWGCCGAWADHLEENGFDVAIRDVGNLAAVKTENHIPPELEACHTAIVDGYVIEGHVPAADIKRLLAERPAVTGLVVPGMPVGSSGMESAAAADPYEVLTFDKSGAREVYARYP
jgi:hypothetical protein